MRIPVYLVIAQWVLLLTLGVLVTLMFRQLGRHLSATRAPAELGPTVGSPAAPIEYVNLAAGADESLRPGDGVATLLAFVDPTCPSCEELVANLNGADADGELAHARSLLLISEPPSYLQMSDPFRQTRLPIGQVLTDAALAAYRVSATPLLVAIDSTGFVRAAGPAIHRQDVRSYVWAALSPAPNGDVLPIAAATQENADRDMMSVIVREEG